MLLKARFCCNLLRAHKDIDPIGEKRQVHVDEIKVTVQS